MLRAKKSLNKVVATLVFASIPAMFSGCATFVVGTAAGATSAIISSDSRTIETMGHDQGIENQAYEILRNNTKLSKSEDFSVSAISMSGNVLLVGQTVNKAYLDWCINEIKKLDYVRKVYNYVSIKRPVSLSVSSNDTFITTQVKKNLLLGDKIKSGRFKVVTEDSNVYLMGYVTKDEAKRAVNETIKVSGIKKVYTIFDYILNEPQLQEQGNEPIEVIPTKTGSSTYVAPVDASDNGGAMIVEDTSSQALETY